MTGAAVLTLAGCAGWGGSVGGGGADTINVLMVNNPQMVDLQRLAPQFTRETGIRVRFTVLPENDLRDKASQEFSSQSGQYDVATLSNFEIPIYAKSGWVAPMDSFLAKDPGFDQQDILGPMRTALSVDGKVYGQPFYGESSFLMYRKDVLAAKGITMPANPTWTQVADIAAKVDGAQPGMRGICLRGQPGWGQLFAPLTTVVNTFGGTWFDQDWRPQVDAPAFTRATSFYVDLVRKHGQSGAPQAGFTECLNNLTQGNVAMWYDATSGAGSLEAAGSPVKGKIGYAPAPVMRTKSSGWLYTWAWAIEQASTKKDQAWKFVSWASSKRYEQLVGERIGWSSVPAGKRASTYADPRYLQAAGAFAPATKKAIETAMPTNPGLQPRPAPGIQFVGIPEFPDLGTQVSQEVSSAIAGKTSVGDALDLGQQLADDVARPYREGERG
ncbi:sorbitol/mannitol transport system substrate-binding protein [Barrientosiimonas humi]|uniref:Sorbitol/mannitol transport system substrate-binding protein n=1 Tax=Barrientosiimonas humi TaxID=999931 RepID=A0A542XC89_9MICO|nr:sugar ABC transporter substrate-binding protein [Barrientosiimonas humi]TQL33453.1 sorbitol/mannitol transport system substrate-binding protein [Barrientosiimonas humi]CAG7573441.1 Erythritol/L-threitol-binding protein [Barrientosiimonas humi]